MVIQLDTLLVVVVTQCRVSQTSKFDFKPSEAAAGISSDFLNCKNH